MQHNIGSTPTTAKHVNQLSVNVEVPTLAAAMASVKLTSAPRCRLEALRRDRPGLIRGGRLAVRSEGDDVSRLRGDRLMEGSVPLLYRDELLKIRERASNVERRRTPRSPRPAPTGDPNSPTAGRSAKQDEFGFDAGEDRPRLKRPIIAGIDPQGPLAPLLFCP
jgi:hypothetical protein